MSGTLPPLLDPLYVNVTGSGWFIPMDWWPVVGLVVGVIIGIMIATALFPRGRSP